VEAYAAYRAAWRALGRPEIDREELELSDGQLRVRVRAHQREDAWAPRYVGNELAGTRQAATRARQDAELRRAEAAADKADRAQLERQAQESAALAEFLDGRAEELVELDDARSAWLAHTASTRAAAERAAAELAARHADDTVPELAVTAEEWLEAHRADQADDETHRNIVDTDLDAADQGEPRIDDGNDDHPDQCEHVEDIREVAAEEPATVDEDEVRVPSADETAAALGRAHRALAEIKARDEADAAEETAHRADELAQWQANDTADDLDGDGDSYDEDVDAPEPQHTEA
jgi:hypothetical protein